MAHKISNECIACGGCQSVCPCEAISEGDGKFEIAADLCVDCGACAAQCPVGAIEEAQPQTFHAHGLRGLIFNFRPNASGLG